MAQRYEKNGDLCYFLILMMKKFFKSSKRLKNKI